MNKLKTPQMLLLIMTLICGIAYLLLKTTMGLNSSNTDNNSFSIKAVQVDHPIAPTPDLTNPSSKSLTILNWQTSNKINVYFVKASELPMIDIDISFKAGAAYEPTKPGVAALTNAMLNEGTKKYNTEEISDLFESNGAVFSASVSQDSSSVSLRSLIGVDHDKKFEAALDVFNDIIANATFPEKDFKRVKNQTLETLKLNSQYPETISSETFYKTLYPNHPYGIPTDGTIDAVQKLTRKDLVAFYTKYYNSNNAQIAIVGDVTEEQAKNISEKIAKNLKTGPAAVNLPGVLKTNNTVNKHINFPSTQTHILLGSVGIQRNDPDYFALTLGNHVLGTMPLTSLLFKNVRITNGLAYSVSSKFVSLKTPGPFLINMQTRNEKATEALNISKNTLSDFLKNGPTQEQLTMAKQNLIGQFPLTIASNSKKLNTIAYIGFYNLPLDYLDTYVNNINKITREDIITAFNKHINLNNLVVVTVGDSQSAQLPATS